MPITFPQWPPAPYVSPSWPENWLRYEIEFPGSGRPSRLAAHATVPYTAQVTQADTTADDFGQILGQVASDYLQQLQSYLQPRGKSLGIPSQWSSDFQFAPNAADLMQWLDVWPLVNGDIPTLPPHLASWNLSRNFQHGLPATIIMVATEILNAELDIGGGVFGLRVPMLVEEAGGKVAVTIRSMTAELPSEGTHGWSTLASTPPFDDAGYRSSALSFVIGNMTERDSSLLAQIGEAASVIPSSIKIEDILVKSDSAALTETTPVILETISKARGSLDRFPNPLSYQVVNQLKLSMSETMGFALQLLQTETCALVTDVGLGEARIFRQTPPASVKPDTPTQPNADYNWSLRRPTRADDVLNRFREVVSVSGAGNIHLKSGGFDVRLCPTFVPQDKGVLGSTKNVQLPAQKILPPRRNEFSAISAFCNSMEFFEQLRAFGIDPETFVVRAETDVQIYYRHGITPGPGKDGRTVNAQVAFDCRAEGVTRPPIRINLALAELSRWDRPLGANDTAAYAQPLGIAMDTRWMLHEFGHYLLAARIGKLEFDFAHSAGDAMAAIACDPDSRLADPRAGVAESFRGVTYPFVFSTRRHDRSPNLGWGWYGALNRSVIAAPPVACEQTKGYLTEQILSSSLFRLYRALGGDTMAGSEPDLYIRQRASFLTLFLLVRAIAGFAQSPSKAEMLELGMEDASVLLAGELAIDPQSALLPPGLPQDRWKGGEAHKVVRWAFETQGMFPQDQEIIHNGMGLSPPVDVYIKDQRPLQEVVNKNRFLYGPGSYCPVSLDWSDSAPWLMSDELIFGNRGTQEAVNCRLRIWLGVLTSDPTEHWGLAADINWTEVLTLDVPALAPDTQSAPFENTLVEDVIDATPGGIRILLCELTCPDDRANTDFDGGLAVRVNTVADLPNNARMLCDLVANDNNLGLRVLGL